MRSSGQWYSIDHVFKRKVVVTWLAYDVIHLFGLQDKNLEIIWKVQKNMLGILKPHLTQGFMFAKQHSIIGARFPWPPPFVL
jgi:hypothetical protein